MILIAGASGGVGRYLFERFSEDSHEEVVGTYHSASDYTGNSNYFQLDISSEIQVEAFVESLKDRLSHIILINCAGISYTSFAHKADLAKWKKVVDINLFGTFNLIHALLPLMREQSYGRIVNFSSVVAKVPTPGVSAYAASKAAIEGLTKTLAVENASKGITVNSLSLGYTNAGMGINDLTPKYREAVLEKIPMKKFCEPEDIYQTLKCVIAVDYFNGASLDLNGGLI